MTTLGVIELSDCSDSTKSTGVVVEIAVRERNDLRSDVGGGCCEYTVIEVSRVLCVVTLQGVKAVVELVVDFRCSTAQRV